MGGYLATLAGAAYLTDIQAQTLSLGLRHATGMPQWPARAAHESSQQGAGTSSGKLRFHQGGIISLPRPLNMGDPPKPANDGA